MNFPETLEYLYQLGNEVLAMKLGLENITKLFAALGDPQKNFLKIQIAGTNGKGSTCAFLDSICEAANIKTGLFTSPHLISITERIKIGGQEMPEKDFARHATKIREISENLVASGELETVPTFFEQVTAIAISAFGEAEIELAILETGLGGRFDATTAARAEIVAITPIDYDHQNILGDTLAKIAAEKAAIIRKDTRVFVAPQPPEAENVIVEKCREVGVEPVWTNPTGTMITAPNGDVSLSLTTGKSDYHTKLKMRGRHQLTNAVLAVYIAEGLRDFGFDASKNHIETGLKNAEHRGRLEFWNRPNAVSLLFDGAHNVAGAEALRAYLDEFIEQPITMIFGAMRDKDLTEIGETLFPKAANLIFTEPDNPRSLKTAELLKFVPKNCDAQIFETPTVAESIEKACEIASKKELILITGSLYLVGEAQKILRESQ